MRELNTLHPTEIGPVPADTVATILLTGGSSAQSFDRPVGAEVCRVTAATTAGGAFACFVNFTTPGAAVPTSGITTASSASHTPVFSQVAVQLPGGSTVMSVAAFTSGLAIFEFWSK